MTELEQIEFELSTKCNACYGKTWFTDIVDISSKQQVEFWCCWCGGSGRERTAGMPGYKRTLRKHPAPYLDLYAFNTY